MLTHSSIQIIFTLMAGKKDAVYLVIGYFVANAMYLTVIFFLTMDTAIIFVKPFALLLSFFTLISVQIGV